MTWTLKRMRFGGVAGLLTLLLAAPAALAQNQPDVLSAWSNEAWTIALSGDREAFEVHLSKLPEAGEDELTRTVRTSASSYLDNQLDARSVREEALVKARAEMAEHIEKAELTLALRAAVDAQSLEEQLEDAFNDESVLRLLARAEGAADVAERGSDWLQAQELLFRLRTMYENTDRTAEYERFNGRLKKVNRRVGLLAQYAPRRLHELRSEQAARLGEEPLPEFNAATATDWRERVDGVRVEILRMAIEQAARFHIEHLGWRPMLQGGLEAMMTLGTTPDLAEAFEGLGDEDAVNRWQSQLERLMAEMRDPNRHVTRGAMRDLIDRVTDLNAETINVPQRVLWREFGDGAFHKLSEAAHDDYSQIIWPDELRRFRQATEGRFVGVGILIRHDDKRDIMVVNPLEGSPAYFKGVRAQDTIAEVDGESTVGWSLNDAVDRITGKEGTNVTLGLRREGEADLVEVGITRAVIKLRSVNGWWKEDLNAAGDPQWNWYIDPVTRVAYVRLTEFNDETPEDLLAAWNEINADGPPNGLILDLRFNPGGLLDSAVQIARFFVDEGWIVRGEVHAAGEQWVTQWEHGARPEQAVIHNSGVPTVVLVNNGSASASEIVSGVLQARGAAVIIGDRSFGKGSVQTVHRISRDSRLKLTTQYYRLPPGPGEVEGRFVHKRPGATTWGVEPDFSVKMSLAQVADSIRLRQAADIIPDEADAEAEPRPDINELLTKGLDPQLQTALLILQTKALGDAAGNSKRAAAF